MTSIGFILLAVTAQAVAETMPDSQWAAGWDKVGSVAISVTVMSILLVQNARQAARIDKVQDVMLDRVTEDTKHKERLTDAIERLAVDQANLNHSVHSMLACREHGCPWREFMTNPRPGIHG